jgi:hypothetical protein
VIKTYSENVIVVVPILTSNTRNFSAEFMLDTLEKNDESPQSVAHIYPPNIC